MNDIIIPKSYNYIGVFLTFACQLKCPYCINNEKGKPSSKVALTGAEWAKHLNRIQTRPDLPITLQGGEPTLHKDFYNIIDGIKKEINIDILTNGQFDLDQFTHRLPLSRLRRDSPYASIRVSYHPPTMSLEDTIMRVSKLRDKGYSVGVWIVNNPKDKLIGIYQQAFIAAGIDCRLKEYLDGKTNGTYKFMDMQGKKNVLCKPSELLIGPDGGIYRCHGDLYSGRPSYANIQDTDINIIGDYTHCRKVDCASCDIKVKYDRFQVSGHCSVDIKCTK